MQGKNPPARKSGIIFYTTEFNEVNLDKVETMPRKYLEATLNDLSGTYEWGGAGTPVNGTEDAIRSGKSNTEKIVNKLGAGSYAAKVAQEYDGGGWFLPSLNELDTMYTNLNKIGEGGFASAFYWSSTENSGGEAARALDLTSNGDAKVDWLYKGNKGKVRPVRSF